MQTVTEADFEGIENERSSGDRHPYITPGEYLLEVDRLVTFISRKKIKFFVAEFKILESSGPNALPAGTMGAHFIKLNLDAAKGNINNLLSSLVNENSSKITSSMTLESTSDSQPCKGRKVRARAVNTTKEDGGDFTKVRYAPV